MSVGRAPSTGLLWLSIALIWFVPASTISAKPSPSLKPNIVIILTDDQGRGDYSAFGTRDIRTPNMDRLFHEGVTFQNFFANSCVCSPSRAALLTGWYPDRVGVPGVIREETQDRHREQKDVNERTVHAGIRLIPRRHSSPERWSE